MLTKKIKCHVAEEQPKTPECWQSVARKEVADILGIVDASHEEWERFIELDNVSFEVGHKKINLWLSPETWDIVRFALMRSACFIIEQENLDKFPYYDKLIDGWSKELGEERGNFCY